MKIELALLLIGAILVLEGLPYFLFPDRIKGLLEKLSRMDSNSLRLIGFVMVMGGFGLVLLFKGRVCA